MQTRAVEVDAHSMNDSVKMLFALSYSVWLEPQRTPLLLLVG